VLRPALFLLPAALLLPAAGCEEEDDPFVDDDTFVPEPGDTTPPELEHDPVSSGAEGVAILLDATASDAGGVSRVAVSYRRPGEASFRTELLDDAGGGVFAGEIPSEDVTPWGIEYYLVAADASGNQASLPDDAPVGFLSVSVTPDPPEPAYNLAAYHDPLRGGAVLSWFHEAEEDFEAYEVRRAPTPDVADGADVVLELTDGALQEAVDPSAATEAESYYRVKVRDIWGGEAWSDVARLAGLHLHQDTFAGFASPAGLMVTGDGHARITDRDRGTLTDLDSEGVLQGESGGLGVPVGVAQGIDTGFYVADAGAPGVRVVGGAGTFGDLIDATAMTPPSWIEEGEVLHLVAPTGITFNSQFQPYLADAGSGRLLRFTDDFIYYNEVAAGGGAALVEPYGVVVDGEGRVFVSDAGRGLVVVYQDSGDLAELFAFGAPGSGDGELDRPLGLDVDRRGYLLVADSGNGRVVRFTPDGTFVDTFGEGVLSVPAGVGVGEDGTVWVADEGLGSAVVFTP